MFEKLVRDNLLAIVAAYRKATGKSLSDVSRTFYGRGGFLAQFKRGKCTLTLHSASVMLEKFRKDWPEGADWPLTHAVMMGRTARD